MNIDYMQQKLYNESLQAYVYSDKVLPLICHHVKDSGTTQEISMAVFIALRQDYIMGMGYHFEIDTDNKFLSVRQEFWQDSQMGKSLPISSFPAKSPRTDVLESFLKNLNENEIDLITEINEANMLKDLDKIFASELAKRGIQAEYEPPSKIYHQELTQFFLTDDKMENLDKILAPKLALKAKIDFKDKLVQELTQKPDISVSKKIKI